LPLRSDNRFLEWHQVVPRPAARYAGENNVLVDGFPDTQPQPDIDSCGASKGW
jgi:hypothetical protein